MISRAVSAALVLICLWLNGCASIAEGITTAVINTPQDDQPQRLCELTGPAFNGLYDELYKEGEKRILKIMMIHGIGGVQPNYSINLQRKLARAFSLDHVSSQAKRIRLSSEQYPERPLGVLQVWRYYDEHQQHEMQFYELTWSEITKAAKASLQYDTSGAYSYQRAKLNQTLKEYINSHVADPAIYNGPSGQLIIASAAQALCWMLHHDWRQSISTTNTVCKHNQVTSRKNNSPVSYAFITHSMGSRIMVDMLNEEVSRINRKVNSLSEAKVSAKFQGALDFFKHSQFRVYMLSNQLPLLQLSKPPAEIVGQEPAYCVAQGEHYAERYLGGLSILAFSDPNDLLSYAIPPGFSTQYLDSRLCINIVNATISVSDKTSLLGMGEIVNPIKAHSGYEHDERVIDLMVHGVGDGLTDTSAAQSCRWLKTERLY